MCRQVNPSPHEAPSSIPNDEHRAMHMHRPSSKRMYVPSMQLRGASGLSHAVPRLQLRHMSGSDPSEKSPLHPLGVAPPPPLVELLDELVVVVVVVVVVLDALKLPKPDAGAAVDVVAVAAPGSVVGCMTATCPEGGGACVVTTGAGADVATNIPRIDGGRSEHDTTHVSATSAPDGMKRTLRMRTSMDGFERVIG